MIKTPAHILGKVNGFETAAVWEGRLDTGWSISWIFIRNEVLSRVGRMYDTAEEARAAFRSTREQIEGELREDMIR